MILFYIFTKFMCYQNCTLVHLSPILLLIFQKALHTLKMWNIVKESERRRKQKMLKDRVTLQHEMIRKQDKLIQEKHKKQIMVSFNIISLK